ncbi:thioesterase family protein [Nocardiopsis sp. MG754419]|uniref:thioesterase family protein n=1 Tax=Nocardiopsis sp. MG754419 TaxID=2259865 RepID=UPI001BA945C4|nr:thioesterase family protein [Nocardiopsis sp. MG754419]MBR8741951.1 thioesterase family protein [Nocardiopsis sp. MG754419]
MSQNAYFVRSDHDRYLPTEHVSGAWNPSEQHFSPLGGLITHAIETHSEQRGLQLSRIGFDILGTLAMTECRIEVRTLRPGRTIELVEALVHIGDRTAVRARAWLLVAGDTSAVTGGASAPLPDPDGFGKQPLSSVWPGGYIASLDARQVRAPERGRGTAWISSDVDLVRDERVGPVASYVALVDTANGVAVRESPQEWMFPNVDLTVHLHRRPEGPWVGLDTTVAFGPTGLGLTSTVLHDLEGEVGRAEQSLTVRPL